MFGWTAAHTGLPSLSVVGPCTVRSGERVVARVADGETKLFSDPLAVVGENVYTDGVDEIVVSRRAGVPWHAIFTGADGRGVDGLILANNNDPVNASSGVAIFNGGAVRWPINRPLATGKSTLVLTDPARESEVWAVCNRRSRVILGPAATTPGVPMRLAVITSVSRSRIGANGTLQFDVSWTESTADVPPAPVVTWGEYAAHSDGFTAETYTAICRRIAGMP